MSGINDLIASTAIPPSFVSPASIPDLALWFDASNGSSITQSGGSVSQWNDLSGNNVLAVQATNSAQPTVQTADLNGLNTLRFTAANSQVFNLQKPAGTTYSLNVSINGATVVAVVKRASSGTLELFSDATASIYAFEIYGDNRPYLSNINGFVFCNTVVTTTVYNQFTISTTPYTDTGCCRCNGADLGFKASTVTSFGNNIISILGKADGAYSNGWVAEVCLYNRVLTPIEYTQVEAYLKAKWATP